MPVFVELLSSNNDDVRDQAIWALGNIAGDSPQTRNFVLQAQALQPLLAQLLTNIHNMDRINKYCNLHVHDKVLFYIQHIANCYI